MNKTTKIFAIIFSVCAICIGILFVGKLQKDNNKKTEEITTTSIVSDIENETSSLYNTLGRNWIDYDKDGKIIGDDLGEFSVNDKTIEYSMLMTSDGTNRTINASIYVLVGGVLTDFYVDGQKYTQYIFEQEKGFPDTKVNICIPIDNISTAYDNTVRICYMGFDQGVPNEKEHRLMTVAELKATITDLNVVDFKPGVYDSVKINSDSSWFQTRRAVIASDTYIDGSVKDNKYNGLDFHKEILSGDEYYAYYCGNPKTEYIIYYLENGKIIADKGILYEQQVSNTIMRSKIELESQNTDELSMGLIVVPINNFSDSIGQTLNMYGFK